jgi:multicomponent Na+:H+ antiporter subunit D
MLALTLNPGFVCILAALVALATPRGFRPFVMAGSAILALWLMLDREFGAATAAAQMGLPVVLLDLDALNRIFGIAMLIALIVLAVASGARRSRSEDAAILTMAGGAVSALFVGDLVSFVAAASIASLAQAWLVFASPVHGAARSGERLLIWLGLEGLLFLVGVAFQLSANRGSSIFGRLDPATIGGACIFAATLIRAGAPLAHVWLKDAISHASPVGAAAITAFSTMLGVYALARLFPAEPLLVPIGLALAVLGSIYALTEDDLRRAAASGLSAQTGVCAALVGVGSPLAMAAAEGHAFTATFAFIALILGLGAILGRAGDVRASTIEGRARTMPLTALLIVLAGLSAASVPGLALYVTTSIALEATAQWEVQYAWIIIASVPPMLLMSLMLRPASLAFRAPPLRVQIHEAPFPMLLSIGLALFFCVSVGMAPAWLYGLLPTELTFEPYAIDRVAPQLELLGAAGVTFLVLRALSVTPAERPLRMLDVDALYRGPASGAARWVGVVLMRIYGAWQAFSDKLAVRGASALARLVRETDRPYRTGALPAVQLAAIAIALAIALTWRQF